MAWGILIGVALTVLSVVLAVAFGKKEFSPLSYIVIVVALVGFSLEGIKYIHAVNDKKDAAEKANNIAAIAETLVSITGDNVQNYRLGIAEATAIKAGLRFAYPDASKYIEPSDLMGKTMYECTEVWRESVIKGANHRIWEAVIWMAGTLVVSILLVFLSTNVGGGRRKSGSSASTSSDDSYTSSHCDDF